MMYSAVRIDQTVDQLVRVASAFHIAEKKLITPSDRVELVQEVAAQVKEFSLDGQAMNRLLFSPFRERLISDYGPADGTYLSGEVVKTLRG